MLLTCSVPAAKIKSELQHEQTFLLCLLLGETSLLYFQLQALVLIKFPFVPWYTRMNFTLRHMDVSCDAYNYFSHCLSQLHDLTDGRCCFKVEQLPSNFAQFFPVWTHRATGKRNTYTQPHFILQLEYRLVIINVIDLHCSTVSECILCRPRWRADAAALLMCCKL